MTACSLAFGNRELFDEEVRSPGHGSDAAHRLTEIPSAADTPFLTTAGLHDGLLPHWHIQDTNYLETATAGPLQILAEEAKISSCSRIFGQMLFGRYDARRQKTNPSTERPQIISSIGVQRCTTWSSHRSSLWDEKQPWAHLKTTKATLLRTRERVTILRHPISDEPTTICLFIVAGLGSVGRAE